MQITTFTVLPSVPGPLAPLLEIAYNLWFSWNFEAARLFLKLDKKTWRDAQQNPVRMLCMLSPEKLEAAARDAEYLEELQAVHARLRHYLAERGWYERKYHRFGPRTVAYFCLEYGLHESLPIYSGGLGVLAGDHLKSASDLAIPVVAVGLLYREGYFRQYLNAEGVQQESYPENDWYSMPVHRVKDADGKPVKLAIEMGPQLVHYLVWRVEVGRVQLYLLDSNLPENPPDFRRISDRLYVGDREVRLRQELLLSIGGLHALRALGIQPSVYHMNEGHSAFLSLERIRLLMLEKNLGFEEARLFTWSTSVFTTHTPVPAGNERFNPEVLRAYFAAYVEKLGLSWKEFLALGREDPGNDREEFCMTVLALKLSAFCNGVSKLHGQVSRSMWRRLYPELSESEVPIGSVTNGVHAKSWINPMIANLIYRYSSAPLDEDLHELHVWEHVVKVPVEEVWKAHLYKKNTLVRYVRDRLQQRLRGHGTSGDDVKRAGEVLNADHLIIGFARRFATYKRGSLFLKNLERLAKLLLDRDRPVQFIISGKAHPMDQAGKEVIKEIFLFASRPEFRGRVVFLEDYDMNVARHLVQGVDVWLNNPVRPEEASGTSGMKAAFNGVLNFSILDGWWNEAYQPEFGWAIGSGESYEDRQLQDQVESDILYRILEKDIIPLYYDRNKDGIPLAWVEKMRSAIRMVGQHFSSHRMLMEYVQHYYASAMEFAVSLEKDGFAKTRELNEWHRHLRQEWGRIEFVKVESTRAEAVYVGSTLEVRAWVKLPGLSPDHVIVEACHGPVNSHGHFNAVQRARMQASGEEAGTVLFKASLPCTQGGQYGFAVRVLPRHNLLASEFLPGLIKWA